MLTSCSGSRYGSGRSITPYTTLKIAVAAPIPSATIATPVMPKTGDLRSKRAPKRVSRSSWRTPAPGRSSRDSSCAASMLPHRSRAARRAAAGCIPRAMFASVSRSTWKRISSARSASTCALRKSARTSARIWWTTRMRRFGGLRRSHDERDGCREPFPIGAFLLESPAAGCCELVESSAPVGLGDPPLGRDPAPALESLERRIERPLVDLEHVVGQELDALRDGPAVELLAGNGAHDEQVEGALDEIGGLRHVRLPWLSTREYGHRVVDNQGESGVGHPLPGV